MAGFIHISADWVSSGTVGLAKKLLTQPSNERKCALTPVSQHLEETCHSPWKPLKFPFKLEQQAT